MEFRQTKFFRNRIITERDVATLEKILDDAFNADVEVVNSRKLEVPGQTYFGRVTIGKSVKCDDLSEFTISYNLDSLRPASICNQPEFMDKKVREIDLDFWSSLNETKKISISFSEGRYIDKINVLVSSSNKDFMQLYFAKITEAIQGMRQHTNLYIRHPSATALAIILLLNQALNSTFDGIFWILFKFNLIPLPPHLAIFTYLDQHENFFDKIFWGRNLLLSTVVYFGYVKPYLQSMYPPIEFEFVPQHKRRAYLRRKNLAFISTAIALPAIVGIIVNLVTG